MAVITKDTFDPLRRYVGVRLGQGVPILDADVNEREDIRQFELRAFLKWYVGDGVPEGNDGFRIEATGADNDFYIRAGAPAPPMSPITPVGVEKGLNYVGRCLVDGQDVIITDDLKYSAQPLTSAAEANKLGVPVISSLLTITSANILLIVYLDVWTRLVTPTEDPSLILSGLGTETCARNKREWAVRTRLQTAVGVFDPPKPGDSDYKTGHSYYTLATINRRQNVAAINPADVIDRRDRRLLMSPATLTVDTLGVGAVDYRRGQKRPIVSLRDAINALLRGDQVPTTKDTAVADLSGLNEITQAFLFDELNRVVAFWGSTQPGSAQVFGARMSPDELLAFSPPVQLTTGVPHSRPHAVLLPTSELLLAYAGGTPSNIFFKRAAFSGLAAAKEEPVTALSGANVGAFNPRIVLVGNLAVFFFGNNSDGHWKMRRYNYAAGTWVDNAPVDVPIPPGLTYNSTAGFHAAGDGAGKIWIAMLAGSAGNLYCYKFDPTITTPTIEVNGAVGNVMYGDPFILCRTPTDVFIFFRTPTNLSYVRSAGVVLGPAFVVSGTTNADSLPTAVADGNTLWLFHTFESGPYVYHQRLDLKSNTWSPGKSSIVGPPSTGNSSQFPLLARNNTILLFWISNRTGSWLPYFKYILYEV